MSTPIREGTQRGNQNPAPLTPKPSAPPKAQGGAIIPHGSKEQEIENLKRLLANVSQRLDALKTK